MLRCTEKSLIIPKGYQWRLLGNQSFDMSRGLYSKLLYIGVGGKGEGVGDGGNRVIHAPPSILKLVNFGCHFWGKNVTFLVN